MLPLFASACQNTNSIPVTATIATFPSTNTGTLSPNEAMVKMYGENVVLHGYSEQSDASITIGEFTYNIRINILSCYWEIELEIPVEKCMVVTEKAQTYGGHPTGAIIDAAIFDRGATDWKVRYLKTNMIALGSFGQIPQGQLIQIGRRNYATLLRGVYANMGGEFERLVIIAETKQSLGIIFQIVSSQSKISGTGLPDEWAYNARLQFQMGDYNDEYYRIVVRYYGTSQSGITPPMEIHEYVDPQYIWTNKK